MTSRVFGTDGALHNNDIIACLIDKLPDHQLCNFVQTCRSIYDLALPTLTKRKFIARYRTINVSRHDLKLVEILRDEPRASAYIKHIVAYCPVWHRQTCLRNEIETGMSDQQAFIAVFDRFNKMSANEINRLEQVVWRSGYRLNLLWALSIALCPNVESLTINDDFQEWLWLLSHSFTGHYWVAALGRPALKVELRDLVLWNIKHLTLGGPLTQCEGNLITDCRCLEMRDFAPLCALPNLQSLTYYRVAVPRMFTMHQTPLLPTDFGSRLERLTLIQSSVHPFELATMVDGLPNLRTVHYDQIDDFADQVALFDHLCATDAVFKRFAESPPNWPYWPHGRATAYMLVLRFYYGAVLELRDMDVHPVPSPAASYTDKSIALVIQKS